MSKITYDELKLGERAKEMFESGVDANEILKQPTYLNTRNVFCGLNTTDMAIAGVLSNLNLLLVGDTGTGKTQLADDIFNYYFGGNKAENGHGVKIRGRPDLDVYNEIFTRLNINKASRELTDSIDALIYEADEINRCPRIGQNQFLGMGDGSMDYSGSAINLGIDGYHLLLATANLGNGEFGGTFESDKALYNRLHIALDFDYEMFKPTQEDRILIGMLKSANPNVKECEKRDISDKILKANKEISEIALNPGIEASAVINYLQFGLENCVKNVRKEKIWPYDCQDCDKRKEISDVVCSLIKAPTQRTVNAMIKYAAGLYYLSKLKNPELEVDAVDLMFKSFELTSAYQMLLNPGVLNHVYKKQNPKMMADVVDKLKEDFRDNEDYIITSFEEAEKGRKVVSFFESKKDNRDVGIYSGLSKDSKKEVTELKPYNDKREIGLGWVPNYIDVKMKLAKKLK